METEVPPYLRALIPALIIVFFSAIRVGVTDLLGAMSGWYRLQREFPDRSEQPLAQCRSVNGAMGRVIPVNFRYYCGLPDMRASSMSARPPRG